jgi:hypothetical protein
MGLVTAGPPAEIVLQLAKLAGARVFVETGTFQGTTALWASAHFESVVTVERDENLHALHHEALNRLAGVRALLGDTRTVLPSVVAGLGGQRAVFWLDSHWSGEGTAGEGDECPLLDELACLAQRRDDIILIDDARFFLCAPPPPHDPAQWPGIADVVDALSAAGGRPCIQIVDDVVFAVPSPGPLQDCVMRYAQGRSGAFWKNYAEFARAGAPERGLGGAFSALKRRITRG